MGLALCAVVAGARSFTATAEWAADADISLGPWRIGKIVAAALVLLHFDHAVPRHDTQ